MGYLVAEMEFVGRNSHILNLLSYFIDSVGFLLSVGSFSLFFFFFSFLSLSIYLFTLCFYLFMLLSLSLSPPLSCAPFPLLPSPPCSRVHVYRRCLQGHRPGTKAEKAGTRGVILTSSLSLLLIKSLEEEKIDLVRRYFSC